MSLYNAYNTCDETLNDHYCDPCGEQEEGGVRGVAFIKKTYLDNILAAPSNVSNWQAGINAGDIQVIPFTSGSYDPGDPKETKGFGDRRVTYGARTQTLSFFDPNYFENRDFWNAIHRISDFVVAWRTKTLTHIADVPATIFAKNPIADDIQEIVYWNIVAKWDSKELPDIFNTPLLQVFQCAGA